MALPPRTIRRTNDDYPVGLRRLRRPPEVLYVDGSLDAPRAIAIVGTRRATPAALDFTRRMARELAEAGVVIVSGGAEGVDAAAHEGALDAPSGRTIAVLPTPIARPYPPAHAGLFARIATRGARITEYATGTPGHRGYFVERNRIIAALSQAVIVVQAPIDSGALQTAKDARALGIPVLAVPWSPMEHAAVGGLALLANGARLCRGSDDALRGIGELSAKQRVLARVATPCRDDDERTVLACVDDVAADRETLLLRAKLPASRALAALMRLVIDGAVVEDAHGITRR